MKRLVMFLILIWLVAACEAKPDVPPTGDATVPDTAAAAEPDAAPAAAVAPDAGAPD